MVTAYEPKYCLVKWIDARKGGSDLNLRELPAGRKPLPVWSIGFAHIAEGHILLAQDFYPLETGDLPGDEQFRQWITIPKVCITEVIELKTIEGPAVYPWAKPITVDAGYQPQEG